MDTLQKTLANAWVITGFVGAMMLAIEYLNVASHGHLQERLSKSRLGQYMLAAFLGATPGCLGAFAVVALYTHRRLTLGAVVAAMIATSGDEAFVMLALIPRTAALLTALLASIGILAGFLTDVLLKNRLTRALSCEADFHIHEKEWVPSFSLRRLCCQWRDCTAERGILSVALLIFLFALMTGKIGEKDWNAIHVALLAVSAFALFVVATVPDHFLEKHLWKHVFREHLPRIFLWTFCALLVVNLLVDRTDLSGAISEGKWATLVIASLLGLIPESGPHLIFVTFYDKGLVTFAVLLASSIVQDGHGMLPMLAHSRRAFLVVKGINLLVGLIVGAIVMLLMG